MSAFCPSNHLTIRKRLKTKHKHWSTAVLFKTPFHTNPNLTPVGAARASEAFTADPKHIFIP